MGKKTIFENWRVEVIPKLGWLDDRGDPHKWRDACDGLLRDINRHCDDLSSVSVNVDQRGVCSHCGAHWTEDSDTYNGGCCDDDERANPAYPDQSPAKHGEA